MDVRSKSVGVVLGIGMAVSAPLAGHTSPGGVPQPTAGFAGSSSVGTAAGGSGVAVHATRGAVAPSSVTSSEARNPTRRAKRVRTATARVRVEQKAYNAAAAKRRSAQAELAPLPKRVTDTAAAVRSWEGKVAALKPRHAAASTALVEASKALREAEAAEASALATRRSWQARLDTAREQLASGESAAQRVEARLPDDRDAVERTGRALAAARTRLENAVSALPRSADELALAQRQSADAQSDFAASQANENEVASSVRTAARGLEEAEAEHVRAGAWRVLVEAARPKEDGTRTVQPDGSCVPVGENPTTVCAAHERWQEDIRSAVERATSAALAVEDARNALSIAEGHLGDARRRLARSAEERDGALERLADAERQRTSAVAEEREARTESQARNAEALAARDTVKSQEDALADAARRISAARATISEVEGTAAIAAALWREANGEKESRAVARNAARVEEQKVSEEAGGLSSNLGKARTAAARAVRDHTTAAAAAAAAERRFVAAAKRLSKARKALSRARRS